MSRLFNQLNNRSGLDVDVLDESRSFEVGEVVEILFENEFYTAKIHSNTIDGLFVTVTYGDNSFEQIAVKDALKRIRSSKKKKNG